jgi:hypothetical protein
MYACLLESYSAWSHLGEEELFLDHQEERNSRFQTQVEREAEEEDDVMKKRHILPLAFPSALTPITLNSFLSFDLKERCRLRPREYRGNEWDDKTGEEGNLHDRQSGDTLKDLSTKGNLKGPENARRNKKDHKHLFHFPSL